MEDTNPATKTIIVTLVVTVLMLSFLLFALAGHAVSRGFVRASMGSYAAPRVSTQKEPQLQLRASQALPQTYNPQQACCTLR